MDDLFDLCGKKSALEEFCALAYQD